MATSVRPRAAVLGSPIAHSLSPLLHRAAYASADLDWQYDAIDVKADELTTFLSALSERWMGLSLTMPLKEAVLPLLAGLSEQAQLTAAVNTVVLPSAPTSFGDGAHGYNTDIVGIVRSFQDAGRTSADTAVVLGSGATARSAAAAAAAMGVANLQVVARNASAAARVVEVAAASGVGSAAVVSWDERDLVRRRLSEAEVVVSTVPTGVADVLESDVGAAHGTLLDVVYDPWPTALARGWGGPVVPGLSMLVQQAAEQVQLMAGVTPDVAAMKAAVGL